MKVEWEARYSGGMKEAAVLVIDGRVTPQKNFSRHIHHISGGSELYRADVAEGNVVFLYQSGSGKTQTAHEIVGEGYWDNWDDAEHALDIPEGSLEDAFYDL